MAAMALTKRLEVKFEVLALSKSQCPVVSGGHHLDRAQPGPASGSRVLQARKEAGPARVQAVVREGLTQPQLWLVTSKRSCSFIAPNR